MNIEKQKARWDESALILYEPIILAVAERTAKLVMLGLQEVIAELKQPPKMQPRWIDYEAAATRLNLTVTALRQRRAAGKIPDSVCSQMGKTIRFDLEALDRWMESLK